MDYFEGIDVDAFDIHGSDHCLKEPSEQELMRYKCSDCGARISTLKNLRAERSVINRLGRTLMVRGECSKCGKRYCFLPEILGPDSPGNRIVNKFARYLADKLLEKERGQEDSKVERP